VTMTKLLTQFVLLACIVLLIGWDIVVAVNKIPGDTISEIVLGYARSSPIIPFAFGVLMGHLFWPQS
jgi:uncharacterized membrane protein